MQFSISYPTELLSLLDGIELMIIIIGCFAQTLAGEAHAVNVIAVIIVWRFIVSLFFPMSDRSSNTAGSLDNSASSPMKYTVLIHIFFCRWVSELEATTRYLQSSRLSSPRQRFVVVS